MEHAAIVGDEIRLRSIELVDLEVLRGFFDDPDFNKGLTVLRANAVCEAKQANKSIIVLRANAVCAAKQANKGLTVTNGTKEALASSMKRCV